MKEISVTEYNRIESDLSGTSTIGLNSTPIANIGKSLTENDEAIKEKNTVTSFRDYRDSVETNYINPIENPLQPSENVFSVMNKYRGNFVNDILVLDGVDNPDNVEKLGGIIYAQSGAPSLFNPYGSVVSSGPTQNTPLLDTTRNGDVIGESGKNTGSVKTHRQQFDINPSDCSIDRLVRESQNATGTLGQARYKYADFMYCKDLGKVSNNRLITLRKFADPVGDNIFRAAAYNDDISNVKKQGALGTLVAWFDTEDNKLDDILNYSVNATWKDFESGIQELPSQENDQSTGLNGRVVNLFHLANSESVKKGVSPNAISALLDSGSSSMFASNPYGNNPAMNGTNYDNHKIYTPKDVIRKTMKYEGFLEFKHEFTLVFNYTLRSYDNINPKAAMLDLLGNILNVTYRTGKFWGGQQKIIGTPRNAVGWNKAKAFTGTVSGGVCTFLQQISNGSGVGGAMGQLFQTIKGGLAAASGLNIDGLMADPLGALKNLVQSNSSIFANNIQGGIANAMGRPTAYAFDSLLTGEPVGLWHVTIGNPLNPIVSMGNLVMTDAVIQHYGPLGLDDFPTGLKVTVSLKHPTPRDSVEIQKMYTRGERAIFTPNVDTNNYSVTKNSVIKKENNVEVIEVSSPTNTGSSSKLYSEIGLWDQQGLLFNTRQVAH